jgi:hypothetical protein
VAALVLVALLEARALGIEADAETIHSARAKAVPGPTGFYVLARRRDDPASVRDPRIAAFSAALRRAGPSDPLEGWIACEALAGTWDAATADSKRWHGILAKHGRSSTRDGSWLPRGWQGGSRHAATALLVLLMDSWDRGNRP